MKAANVGFNNGSTFARGVVFIAVLNLALPNAAPPVSAQTAVPKFKVDAERVDWLLSGDVRLEGKAHVQTPQLDARAQSIAVDFKNNRIFQVRAQKNVVFKLD